MNRNTLWIYYGPIYVIIIVIFVYSNVIKIDHFEIFHQYLARVSIYNLQLCYWILNWSDTEQGGRCNEILSSKLSMCVWSMCRILHYDFSVDCSCVLLHSSPLSHTIFHSVNGPRKRENLTIHTLPKCLSELVESDVNFIYLGTILHPIVCTDIMAYNDSAFNKSFDATKSEYGTILVSRHFLSVFSVHRRKVY